MRSAKLRVLLVEDDPDIREIDGLLLEPVAETVVAVPDVYQALDHLEHEPVDVVIADLMLPGANGLELLRRVIGRHPDVPIVIVSGFAPGPMATEALALGAAAVLPKPTPSATLLATVVAAADGRHGAPGAGHTRSAVPIG
jgi:CheY-like chemotaxis protein